MSRIGRKSTTAPTLLLRSNTLFFLSTSVRIARNAPAFFAEKLYKSMKVSIVNTYIRTESIHVSCPLVSRLAEHALY